MVTVLIVATLLAAGVYGYQRVRPYDRDDWMTRAWIGVMFAFVIGGPLVLVVLFAYACVTGEPVA